MDFGIGLILSFTDNASAGINNAVNSLDRLTQSAEGASQSLSDVASLSALSVVASRTGDALLNAGTSIIGVFSELLGKTRDVGSEFEGFRVTLNALYGDAEKAETAIGKLLDFSIKSPFEVSGVKDMLIVLQSQGIDAFQEIQGQLSDTRQETLGWIADLMSFKPDEATTRWKRALTNYIGSGEVRMLGNILDMGDIDQILGHDVGATVEERMNDIIEIVEKKNLTGLSQNLAYTLKGAMSNVADAFTKLYKSIADNGVFDKLKESFLSLSGAILTLDNESLEAMGKTIADGLNLILTPVTYIVKKIQGLITTLVNLCKTNPKLVKFMMVITAISGALLIIGGIVLKLAGALAGVMAFMLMLPRFKKSIAGLIPLFKTKLVGALKKLYPMLLIFGLLRMAWKNDIAGIQTMTKKFVTNLTTAFKTANKAVNGSVDDLINTMNDLNKKDDFFSNLTRGIIKVQMTMKALADAWPDYTLSEENFLKAQELGILPLIEGILNLKYRFEKFSEGFIAGWKEIGENIKNAIAGVVKGVEGTFLEDAVDSLVVFFGKLESGDAQAWYDFGESFAIFTANVIALSLAFKALGSVLNIFTLLKNAVIFVKNGFVGIWKVAKFLAGPFTSMFKTIGRPFWIMGKDLYNVIRNGWEATTVVGKLVEMIKLMTKGGFKFGEAFSMVFPKVIAFFAKVGSIFTKIGGFFVKIGSAIAKFFTTTFGGVLTLIVGVVMAVVGFVKQLTDGFSWLWEIVKWIGIALGVVGAIILGISAWPAIIVGAIVGLLMTIVVLVKQYWTEICDFFVMLGNWIYEKVIKPIADFFVMLWEGIKIGAKAVADFFVGIWNGIVAGVKAVGSFFATIGSWIYNNVIAPVVNFFMTYIFPIIAKIVEIVAKILEIVFVLVRQIIKQIITAVKNFIQGVINVVKTIVSWINTNIIKPIVNFFVGLWNSIVTIVKNIVAGIKNVFSTVASWVNTNIIQPVVTFFTNLWNTIVEKVTAFVSKVKEILGIIGSWVYENIISPVAEFFSGLWNGIVEGVTNFIAKVKEIFGAITSWIKENIIDPIAKFFKGLWEDIKTAFGVVADTVSSVLKGAINTVLGFICNVINGVIKAINLAIGVINKIPGVSITKIELLELPKLAQGGIVNKPTTALIGEAGTEAVMPLENNLGWIGKLASMITSEMHSITPTNSSQPISTSQQSGNQNYMTRNTTNNHTVQGSTDNSVTFSEGAIQVYVQNATEEEARRLAMKVMEYIKRQKQLDQMMNYA